MAYLVTGATGGQGGAVAHQLLDAGHKIVCLVRSPSKPNAVELQRCGAILVEGDFENISAIREACSKCIGLFYNSSAGPEEAQHASNVLTIAKESGIELAVVSSSVRVEEYESFKGINDNPGMKEHMKQKVKIQDQVQSIGFKHWCIVQAAWLMTNWVAPASRFFWAELAHATENNEHVLLSSAKPDTKFALTSPDDMGTFAVAALLNPGSDKFDRKIIKVAGDFKTIGETADIMSIVSGKKAVAKFRTPEEVRQQLSMNPLVWSQNWQATDGPRVDLEAVRAFGLKLTSFKEFLEKSHNALNEAFTSP